MHVYMNPCILEIKLLTLKANKDVMENLQGIPDAHCSNQRIISVPLCL